jgi:integrase
VRQHCGTFAMAAGEIDTAAKRFRLRPRKNPYWQGISGGRGGVSLGFRRTAKGEGVWVAKIVIDWQRIEERIGTPEGCSAGEDPLSFPKAVGAALAWGRQQAASVAAAGDIANAKKIPTVELAVETYVDIRRARADRSGSEGSLKLHVMNDQEFAGLKLGRLEAQNILDWRAGLPNELEPSSKNRILNDLRAALNAAAAKYRRQLPAHILAEIKLGTKAGPVTSLPRRQLLTDAQVRAVVEAAFAPEVDPDGDFGRLVLSAAATGARFSQLAGLVILDFQIENSRLMMPSSRKGKDRQPGARAAVPASIDVMRRLLPAIQQRGKNEPLLLRWGYRQVGGPGNWAKNKRQAWGRASEVDELWAKTVALAGIPAGTVMYALRHSSIVRGLKKNLPVRLVAALHDTSVEMIEKHYAAFIIDMTEDMARQTLLAFDEPQALQAAE